MANKIDELNLDHQDDRIAMTEEFIKLIKNCNNYEELRKQLEYILSVLLNRIIDEINKQEKKISQYSNIDIENFMMQINNINKVWRAVSIKFKIYRDKSSKQFIKNYDLSEDGLKASFVLMYPQFDFIFDLNDYQKDVKNTLINKDDIYIYSSYDQLDMRNIKEEIRKSSISLGTLAKMGYPKDKLRYLANRIRLLEYWDNKGFIDINDSIEFEKDHEKWTNDHLYEEIG